MGMNQQMQEANDAERTERICRYFFLGPLPGNEQQLMRKIA
jgi:hypothetical protein